MTTRNTRTMIRAVLAATCAPAILVLAATAAPAAVGDSTPYRKSARAFCQSDECVVEFPVVPNRKRFDLRMINCSVDGNADFDINTSVMSVRPVNDDLKFQVALPLTPVTPSSKRSLAVHQTMHVPINPRAQIIIQMNDNSSLKWLVDCTISGDLVQVR